MLEALDTAYREFVGKTKEDAIRILERTKREYLIIDEDGNSFTTESLDANISRILLTIHSGTVTAAKISS